MSDNNNPQADDSARSPFETFLFHQRRALEETGRALEALLPKDFRDHGAQATREFTKGLRVLMEAAVDEVKKAADKMRDQQEADKSATADDPESPSTTGTTKVKVQVE